MFGGIGVERLARKPLHERAEDDKVYIAIQKGGAGRVFGRGLKSHALGGFLPLPRLGQIEVRA